MATGKTKFDEYLAEELSKARNGYAPMRSGVLRRLFVQHLPCVTLHPNPEDEFCDPEIGPSNQIISDYSMQFLETRRRFEREYCPEPVIVERIHPDGYLIHNGHHRWAAAMMLGYKTIHVRIVNLTHEKDIQKMILASSNTRRVVFDLDEVLFCTDENSPCEKPLGFPGRLIYRERLRRGIPELFSHLTAAGYDIWVYSKKYYSFDYIRRYFRRRHIHITGVITGIAHKSKYGNSERRRVEALFSKKYGCTLHIDDSAVLRTRRGSTDFEEYRLTGAGTWAQEIIGIIEGMDAHEKQ